MDHNTGKNARNSSSQIKLRSACNQCCIAKVKCSGEKTGCSRCRSSGASCVYLESRVGKVPGIRAKKNQSSSTGSQQRRQQADTSETIQPTSPLSPATDSTSQSKESDQANPIWWSSDWNASPSETITAILPNDPHELHVQYNPPDSLTSQFDSLDTLGAAGNINLTDLDGEYAEMMSSQSPITTGGEPSVATTTAQQTSLLRGLRRRTETDSRCCQDCCQVIMELEHYIELELKDSNIVIGITRQALEKVAQLVTLQQGSTNLRCMMLFSALLYQIVELLEVGLSAVTAEQLRQRSRSLIGGSIGLGFGVFSMDVEAQSSYRSQAILKEIYQAMEIVNNLKTIASLGVVSASTSSNGANTAHGMAPADCYLDLELQLKGLIRSVSKEN
ncbi:hypothetical protein F5Y12DRAFT_717852 [Xylaria sp. FL1777]|nr:hypothetical protein F5Y12DRAFT_717852 [Xylaria sp. FL1777]